MSEALQANTSLADKTNPGHYSTGIAGIVCDEAHL